MPLSLPSLFAFLLQAAQILLLTPPLLVATQSLPDSCKATFWIRLNVLMQQLEARRGRKHLLRGRY